MTTNNPFAARLQQAAQEGYVNGTRRQYAQPQRPAAPQPTFELRATDKQIQLIIDLLNERDTITENRPKFRARLIELTLNVHEVEKLTREKASNLITYLFGLPVTSGTTHEPDAFKAVPAGHYAIERDGAVSFYRVDRPMEGKWAGKVFVALQHGDDYTNMGREAGFTVLGYIVDQGIMECSTRYGKEIGKCGVCHRTLTNAESREAGIGPICRDKFSW
jgi:hypothetical protein